MFYGNSCSFCNIIPTALMPVVVFFSSFPLPGSAGGGT